jgi:WD40 repeat protein
MKIWDIETFQCSEVIGDDLCWNPVFSPDGDWIFATWKSQEIRVFGVQNSWCSGWSRTVSHATLYSTSAIRFSGDGFVLATTCDDAVLCWQLAWIPMWGESKR